ncbi:methyltransferase [Devosia sp. Root413D1]|uniref:O-methyltransferase n=1 Tax=Devosia sp. Root413D1 TaxID=1736531 RepID=UPI0006F77914|nr:O-methyltransferase [Devosia sp. Root413D1]KQW81508.1 methyltransferase [Devosia sp. Root413D1]
MSAELWGRVDDYIVDRLVDEDAALADALQANAASGLRPIDVSAAQGKFLHLLVRMSGARRVLEVGTLGAYSTIWMAKALPAGGSIITLEYEPHHAEVARRNIARAGYAERIEVRVGAAAETLPLLAAEQPEPFDFVFIDADKPSNTVYLDWAIKLGRPGTVIVLDNVVRDGQVANAESRDPNVLGSRGAFELIAANPRLSATALQTVGAKGYDGFAVMILD